MVMRIPRAKTAVMCSSDPTRECPLWSKVDISGRSNCGQKWPICCAARLVTALYPRYATIVERICERCFELERFPIHHWIQMLDEFGQQTHAKSLHRTTGLVASFVLIEAPVTVS